MILGPTASQLMRALCASCINQHQRMQMPFSRNTFNMQMFWGRIQMQMQMFGYTFAFEFSYTFAYELISNVLALY